MTPDSFLQVKPIAWTPGTLRDHLVTLSGEPIRRTLCGRNVRTSFWSRLATDTANPCRSCQRVFRRGGTSW